jgi:ComF family protein
MHSLIGAIQDLLFPPVCSSCGRRLDHSRPPLFCIDCLTQLEFISSPLCPCCGLPHASGADHLCGICLRRQYSFDRARSLLVYTPAIAPIILGLKFGGQLNVLPSLAALTAHSTCVADLGNPDWIIPIPLHGQRLRQRGFNQTTLIARASFPQWRHKIRFDLLTRTRPTVPQSQLSGQLRRTNLTNAFALAPKAEIRGRHFLLIDDVLTTGSTVNECAKLLRRGGAGRIEVYTVARSWPGQRSLGNNRDNTSGGDGRRCEQLAKTAGGDHQVR